MYKTRIGLRKTGERNHIIPSIWELYFPGNNNDFFNNLIIPMIIF